MLNKHFELLISGIAECFQNFDDAINSSIDNLKSCLINLFSIIANEFNTKDDQLNKIKQHALLELSLGISHNHNFWNMNFHNYLHYK